MTALFSFILTSGFARAAIIQIAFQIPSLLFIEAMLGKGRKVWIYLTAVIAKSLLLAWLSLQYFPTHMISPAIFTVSVNCIGSAVTCLLFFYTFQTEPVKGFLCIAVTELCMYIAYIPASIIVNTLEKHTDLFLIYAKYQPLDLLFLLLSPLASAIVYFILRKFLYLFREFKVKQRNLGMAVCMVYFALVQLTSLSALPVKAISPLWADALCLLVLLWIYRNYRQEVTLQQAYVKTQLHLMQSQYRSVQKQMRHIEECQETIDRQMQEFSSLAQSNTAVISEKTSAYLQELRTIYQSLNAGVYCSNWIIDSVLFSRISAAKQKGITVSCEVTDDSSDAKRAELLAQILQTLFDFLFLSCTEADSSSAPAACPDNASTSSVVSPKESSSRGLQLCCDLKIRKYEDQQVILFTCPVSKKNRQLQKKLEALAKKDSGIVQYQVQNGETEIGVLLECSS